MEFFELGIERIHRMISDCFFLALQRGLLFGLLFLGLGIFLVILCRRYNLFKRENRLLRIVASSYYFYVPFVFLVGGLVVGATLATKDYFAKETSKSISPLMKLVFPTYQSHVNTNWGRVVQTGMTFNQTLDEYVSEIKFTSRNGEYGERLSTYTANMMVPKITRWGIESVINTAKDIAIRQSEEQGYIETHKVKALLIVHTLSMFDYPPGLWEQTNQRLEEKLAYFFEGVTGNILIIFFLLLVFPVAETAISRIIARKKNKEATALVRKREKEIFPREIHEDRNETVEQYERIGHEKKTETTVDIEIPKIFEN